MLIPLESTPRQSPGLQDASSGQWAGAVVYVHGYRVIPGQTLREDERVSGCGDHGDVRTGVQPRACSCYLH